MLNVEATTTMAPILWCLGLFQTKESMKSLLTLRGLLVSSSACTDPELGESKLEEEGLKKYGSTNIELCFVTLSTSACTASAPRPGRA